MLTFEDSMSQFDLNIVIFTYLHAFNKVINHRHPGKILQNENQPLSSINGPNNAGSKLSKMNLEL